jgi:hypothetical protein
MGAFAFFDLSGVARIREGKIGNESVDVRFGVIRHKAEGCSKIDGVFIL